MNKNNVYPLVYGDKGSTFSHQEGGDAQSVREVDFQLLVDPSPAHHTLYSEPRSPTTDLVPFDQRIGLSRNADFAPGGMSSFHLLRRALAHSFCHQSTDFVFPDKEAPL